MTTQTMIKTMILQEIDEIIPDIGFSCQKRRPNYAKSLLVGVGCAFAAASLSIVLAMNIAFLSRPMENPIIFSDVSNEEGPYFYTMPRSFSWHSLEYETRSTEVSYGKKEGSFFGEPIGYIVHEGDLENFLSALPEADYCVSDRFQIGYGYGKRYLEIYSINGFDAGEKVAVGFPFDGGPSTLYAVK